MFEEPTLAETVGLKHVIEDGLAVLHGRALAAGRGRMFGYALRAAFWILPTAI